MARLVLKMEISIDGFVGARDGDVRWIDRGYDADLTAHEVDLLAGASAHVMGRQAYEDMAPHWPVSDEPFAAPMNETPKIVFSRSLTATPWGPATVVAGDLAEEVARLKAAGDGFLLAHGGAGFARDLSRLGLVDEYHLNVHPIVLGDGLPMFDAPARMTLVASTAFASGAVAQVYRPA